MKEKIVHRIIGHLPALLFRSLRTSFEGTPNMESLKICFYLIIILTFQAKEDSNPPQSSNISESTVVVHLTVTDENDFVPRFAEANYSGEIPENTQKGVAILMTPEIKCEDLDSVRRILFFIHVEPIFEIEKDTEIPKSQNL